MKSLLLLLLMWNCFAQDTIDMGNLEIEGSVRRPMVNLIDTKEKSKASIEKEILGSIKNLEKKLLNAIETGEQK